MDIEELCIPKKELSKEETEFIIVNFKKTMRFPMII